MLLTMEGKKLRARLEKFGAGEVLERVVALEVKACLLDIFEEPAVDEGEGEGESEVTTVPIEKVKRKAPRKRRKKGPPVPRPTNGHILVGRKLRDLREQAGLTQNELAELADQKRWIIIFLEGSKRLPMKNQTRAKASKVTQTLVDLLEE